MKEPSDFGFDKWVPGFDFLRSLGAAAAAGIAPSPAAGNWLAPTLSVEEIEKRIEALRSVQFWLEQNAGALQATIQALEVQKMTLAVLQGMNLDLSQAAQAAQSQAPTKGGAGAQTRRTKAKPRTTGGSQGGDASARQASEPAVPPAILDPALWWRSLTEQFQAIATDSLKELAKPAAAQAARGNRRSAKRGSGAA